jgi:serine/threonine-protein kinase
MDKKKNEPVGRNENEYIGLTLDGRYKLLECIGKGGMAYVFQAEDFDNDSKSVVVKVMKDEYNDKPDYVSRFKTESRTLSLLSHPNIVTATDIEIKDGNDINYIVTEFIEGITLADKLAKEGTFKINDAVHYTLQTLSALRHAHDKAIIHQDVKLTNVMLETASNSIKLIDFGIARFNRESDIVLEDAKPIGTVHYIPPEQAQAKKTDERSDLYSVGIMMYEMLTGQRPFESNKPLSVAIMQIELVPKEITDINPALPKGLSEIVSKALRKKPDHRYQTATAMINDLERFVKDPNIIFGYSYMREKPKPETNARKENSQMNYERPSRKKNPGLTTDDGLYPLIEDADDGYDSADSAENRTPWWNDKDYDDEVDDYRDEIPIRRAPLIPIMAAAATVFVITAVILIYMVVNGKIGGYANDEMITVPNVIGLTELEVDAKYGNLSFITISRENSTEYPEGAIIRQSPLADEKIKSTQRIELTLSTGPLKGTIPVCSGLALNTAIAQLNAAGFKSVQRVYEADTSGTVHKDYVLRVEPSAGEFLPINTEITLYISLGSGGTGEVEVPNFVGKTIEEAQALANSADLSITIREVDADKPENEGKVMKQYTDQGKTVPPLSNIDLDVGKSSVPVNTFNVSYTVNDAVTGKYYFKFFIDGVEQTALRELRDISLNRNIRWEITGSTVATYTISIQSIATGKEAKFYEAILNFKATPPTEEQLILNTRIFSDISGSETNPPDTTATATTEPTPTDATTVAATEATTATTAAAE